MEHRRAAAGPIRFSPRQPDAGTGRRAGIESHHSGLHGFGARLGGREISRFAFRRQQRRRDRIASRARLLPRSRGRAAGDSEFLRGAGSQRRQTSGVLRLGFVERAAHHQLGDDAVHGQSRILFLPPYRRAIPPLARSQTRLASRAQPRVVSPLHLVGAGHAAALQHDSFLHRLSRLALFRDGQTGRGFESARRGCVERGAARSGDEPRRRAVALHFAADGCGRAGRLGYGSRDRILGHVVLSEAFVACRTGRGFARRSIGFHALGWLSLLRRFLHRRDADRLRHGRFERQRSGDAGGREPLGVERNLTRRKGRQLLRLLSDERRLRIGRLRIDQPRRAFDRTQQGGWRSRQSRDEKSRAAAERKTGEGAGRSRLQPAGLYGRRAAPNSVSGRAGRIRRRRARFVDGHLPRDVPNQRAN
ncbi:MAG: hypothetical protein JMDDDDMK_01841 [Acidobacteria bacterium]|nr:hypothetical protein [Acidobacteriota bacterium]